MKLLNAPQGYKFTKKKGCGQKCMICNLLIMNYLKEHR